MEAEGRAVEVARGIPIERAERVCRIMDAGDPDFPPVGEGGVAVLGGGGYYQAKSPSVAKDPDDENATDSANDPSRQKEDAFT